MPKLATPVQYEPALEGLNDIRPLALADEVKIVIPYPVLCKNPPSVNRPAAGKFARCSQRGALLKSVPVWADKVYETSLLLTEAEPLVSYTFPQTVFGVLGIYDLLIGEGSIDWCNDADTAWYMEISSRWWNFLPFVGRTIYLSGYDLEPWNGNIKLSGFYK